MKCNIRIISQVRLADPKKMPGLNPRLHVYGSANFTLHEPYIGNDSHNCLVAWISNYQKILQQDPSAVLKIVPEVVEQPLPFI